MEENLGRYVNWHVFRCKCSDCGTIMDEGYVLYDGEAYYCSDSCLYEHFSEDDYEEAFQQAEACWMEWY